MADFTYVWTYAGFCYVWFVTDAASRRILGWKATMSMETPLATDALEQALSLRRRTNTTWKSPQHVETATARWVAWFNAECLTAVSIEPNGIHEDNRELFTEKGAVSGRDVALRVCILS